MTQLCLVNIEWNQWNGLVFEILRIEYGNFDGALFGFWVGERKIILDILFINIEIKSPIH